MKKFAVVLLILAFIDNFGPVAYAVSLPRPIGNESRIKVVNYMPNTVVRFVGHYTYHSIIEFGPDEEIKTISMGTPTAWQIFPEGNRIFLKPIGEDATTNMTVMTNKRMYFFEMHAEYADSISDQKISFITKFMYPENYVNSALGAVTQLSAFSAPDLTRPEIYNFKYAVSGKAQAIEPILVFDDGEFTYLKFMGMNTELPAIFLVDSRGNEGLINYRIAGNYVVIERVANKFTLRHGHDVICVFNEALKSNIEQSVPNAFPQSPTTAEQR
ncbi:type IV secretion system protein VirB9 [Alphaproteobacteria bacterium]